MGAGGIYGARRLRRHGKRRETGAARTRTAVVVESASGTSGRRGIELIGRPLLLTSARTGPRWQRERGTGASENQAVLLAFSPSGEERDSMPLLGYEAGC